MIELVFELAGEIVITKLDGINVFFANYQTGFETAVPIDMIKLDIAGIIKEFPDLKDMQPEPMRQEALARFKDNIKDLKTEELRKKYLIHEFEKMGYVLKNVHKEGFRARKF